MSKLVENINLINVAAKNTKVVVPLQITKAITQTLDILVEYNMIEYKILNKKAIVTLRYANLKPTIKVINYMGGNYYNNINYLYAKKELNTKKSLYIVRTSLGIMTLESAVKFRVGCTILFKITI
jgi:ribosomal protein S8